MIAASQGAELIGAALLARSETAAASAPWSAPPDSMKARSLAVPPLSPGPGREALVSTRQLRRERWSPAAPHSEGIVARLSSCPRGSVLPSRAGRRRSEASGEPHS